MCIRDRSKASRGTSKMAACARPTGPDWASSSIAQRLPSTTSIFASMVRRAGTSIRDCAAPRSKADSRELMKNSIATVCGLLLAIMSGTASAQNYPAKGVKIVVPLGTGSASDAMTRIAAQKLNELWAQPVVVENQPGANGIPATAAVVKSPPDGYTLMIIAANH